jgi:hypothetical protein
MVLHLLFFFCWFCAYGQIQSRIGQEEVSSQPRLIACPSIPAPPLPPTSLPLCPFPLSSVCSSLPPPQTWQASSFLAPRAPVLTPAHTQNTRHSHKTLTHTGQEAAEASPEPGSSRKAPLLPGCCSSACLLAQGVLVPSCPRVLVWVSWCPPSSSGSLVAFSPCSFVARAHRHHPTWPHPTCTRTCTRTSLARGKHLCVRESKHLRESKHQARERGQAAVAGQAG